MVPAPEGLEHVFENSLRVERLREVRALIGFTRIEAPGELTDEPKLLDEHRVPLSRRKLQWVPASEVRGEGIFLRFKEEQLAMWCSDEHVRAREDALREGHKMWRKRRGLKPPEDGFPGIRHVLIHSFAHAVMRQMALSVGYTSQHS